MPPTESESVPSEGEGCSGVGLSVGGIAALVVILVVVCAGVLLAAVLLLVGCPTQALASHLEAVASTSDDGSIKRRLS
jgi:hypothetical protein